MTASKITEVKELADLINTELKTVEIRIGERYGYKAIDLYEKGTGKMKRTLIAGLTATNAYDYLNAMCKILEIIADEKKVQQ